MWHHDTDIHNLSLLPTADEGDTPAGRAHRNGQSIASIAAAVARRRVVLRSGHHHLVLVAEIFEETTVATEP